MTSAGDLFRRASRGLRGDSLDGRVARAMLVVGALTAAVKLAAILKEAVVAARLGTGAAADAYAIAYRLPAWCETVVALSFALAVVPAWVNAREKRGDEAAARLLGQATTVLLIGLLAVTGLVALVGPLLLPLMGRSFDAQRLSMAQSALSVLLPFILPIGLYHCWAGVLNARERFALAAAAPFLTPLCVMAAVLILPPERGATALALGTTTGAALQAALIGAALMGKGHGLRPRWPSLSDPGLRDVLDRLGPLALAHGIFGLSPLIDHTMAATLGPSSNAVLEFGSRIPAAVASLGTVAVGAAVLPYFAGLSAREEWPALRRSLNRWLLILVAATAPIVILLIALSAPLTRLLFQRGAFSATDSALVAPVLALGALQVMPHLLNLFLVRVLTALRGHRIVLAITGLLVVANVGFNWLLMRPLGVPGIALSSALVYTLGALLAWVAIRRRLASVEGAEN